ncbi:MAG: hypothetical protein QM489_01280, partial [Candidatus Izemoplasma sp.]
IVILQFSTVLTIGVLLVLIGVQQNNYIDEFETPLVQVCYYYDDYGNYIHGSRLIYTCPVPNVIEDNESILIMEFEYYFIGERDNTYSGGSHVLGDYEYTRVDDGYVMVRVELHYNTEGIIIYRRYQEVVNYIQLAYLKDETVSNWADRFTKIDEMKITNYYEHIISTDFEVGEIIQTKNEYVLNNQIDVFSNLEDYSYYEFDQSSPTRDAILSVYYEEEDSLLTYQVYKDFPYNDNFGDYISYVGFISKNENIVTLDFRWTDEQLNPNITPFREISDVYTIVDDNISTRMRTYLGYYSDYSYGYIEQFGVNIMTGEIRTSEFANIDDYESHWNLIEYRGSYYFSKNYQQFVLSQTEYGFIVKQYGIDGVKSDEKPYVDAGELINYYASIDARTLNSLDLIYINQPIFTVNPIIRFFLID